MSSWEIFPHTVQKSIPSPKVPPTFCPLGLPERHRRVSVGQIFVTLTKTPEEQLGREGGLFWLTAGGARSVIGRLWWPSMWRRLAMAQQIRSDHMASQETGRHRQHTLCQGWAASHLQAV